MCLYRLFLGLIVCVALTENNAFADSPKISDRLPIQSRSNISPPTVGQPVHPCALAVNVMGFVPHATVSVYADGVLVGTAVPKEASAEISLTQALEMGQSITATQQVGAVVSSRSYDPVIVSKYPTLTTPVAVPDVYECGIIVPVANLTASTHVEVWDEQAPPPPVLGTAEATGEAEAVVTSKLVRGHHVIAQQTSCPTLATAVKSPLSAPLQIKPAPRPPNAPTLDQPVIGSEQVVVHKLLVGSHIETHYGAKAIDAGYANATDNVAYVPPVPPNVPITATQALCDSSPPSPVVIATDQLPTPHLGGPICAGSKYVVIENTLPGANVVLRRGGEIIGYAGGALGSIKLAVGPGIDLADNDVLTAIQYVSSDYGTYYSAISNELTVGCEPSGDVITEHNDNFRTGLNAAEPFLTPAAVLARGMHIKYQQPIAGGMMAQPLFVRNVQFTSGQANGLFIATSANIVYGLNADSGTPQWTMPLKDSDTDQRLLPQTIDSTPVIDLSTQRMYVVFSTKNMNDDIADFPDSHHPGVLKNPDGTLVKNADGTIKQPVYEDTGLKNLDTAFWLAVLDIRSGAVLAQTRIQASTYRTNGQPLSFEAPFQRQRPALLLDHGSLYVAFGAIAGNEGFLEYHGWVFAYRAQDLALTAQFVSSRDYAPTRSPYQFHPASAIDGAGIWGGGAGLTADRDGNVYFLTGNGGLDVDNYKYGDAFIKLTPNGASLTPDVFTPDDALQMVTNDADLGAGGTMIIPGTELVIGGGKPGYMYSLDRRSMTLEQSFSATTNFYIPADRDNTWNMGPHLHSSPGFWRGADSTSGNLYVWGEKDWLRRYRVDMLTGTIDLPTPNAHHKGLVVALPDTMPGGMLSISSLANRPGTGVVWATLPTNNNTNGPYAGHLYAYDAESITPLWDGDAFAPGHWLVPTVANGNVFVGTTIEDATGHPLSAALVAWELGPENRNSSGTWQPTLPREPNKTMSSMHRMMDRRQMLAQLNQPMRLSPPPGMREYAVVDASAAKTRNRKSRFSGLATRIGPDSGQYPYQVNFEVRNGRFWSASDGSSAVGRELGTGLTAGKQSWTLFEFTDSKGEGILAGIKYLQSVVDTKTAVTRSRAYQAVPQQSHYFLYRQNER